MYLASVVVATWSLTQEVAGSKSFDVMTNNFGTEFSEFNENIQQNISYIARDRVSCLSMLINLPRKCTVKPP